MKPKIAILEQVHPAGIAALKEFANIDFCLHLSRHALLNRIHLYHAIVIKSVTQVDKTLLDKASLLQVIARAGVGTDNIDIDYAKEKNITILTTPRGNTISAAEFTITLILMLCKRLSEVLDAISQSDFRRHLLEGKQLSELTVGLIGLGDVALEVAKRLVPFGCKIIGYSQKTKYQDKFLAMGVHLYHNLKHLMSEVDVLSLHASLNPSSKNMINADTLSIAKPGMLLVNTARGAIIDDEALLQALNNGRIAAVATDVLCPEPPYDVSPKDHNYTHPLLHHKNVIVTPHIASSTTHAQKHIALSIAASLNEFFKLPMSTQHEKSSSNLCSS